MSKVDIIIWTFNRAMQLDLLLRSIKEKFLSVGDVYILYTYSNSTFRAGYDLLRSKKYNLNIIWVKETKFSDDTRDILNKMKTTCFLGLCDDDVFVKRVDISKALPYLEKQNANAFSLKAGLNITHNYPDFKLQYPEMEIIHGVGYAWEWAKNPPGVDWGYPTCTNSFIFNIKYYLELIKDLEFNQTANLEGGLNGRRNLFRPLMICYEESSLLNIPANRLQTISDNPFGQTHPYSAEEFNTQLLAGKRISTKNIYEHRIYMPNIELPLTFEDDK